MTFALPESVLVVVHTPDLHVLLLQRVARPGWWQSVTGAREERDATLHDTARRELFEETGIDADTLQAWNWVNRYTIWQAWRHRYGPDVTHNVEHTFSLSVDAPRAVSCRRRNTNAISGCRGAMPSRDACRRPTAKPCGCCRAWRSAHEQRSRTTSS